MFLYDAFALSKYSWNGRDQAISYFFFTIDIWVAGLEIPNFQSVDLVEGDMVIIFQSEQPVTWSNAWYYANLSAAIVAVILL